jgi:tRNA modification GTPase
MTTNVDEPIAAIASATGGAVAVLRGSGAGAGELFAAVFSRGDALLAAPPNTLFHGWVRDPKTGARVDEVMAVRFSGPKRFTGEDGVEIYCHGGSAVVQGVLRVLLDAGFRQSEPGEFTLRAFIHGKTDLTRAEAVGEIVAAKTDAARGSAVERLAGGLFDAIDGVKKLLLGVRAACEAEIEYPEDEEAIKDAFDPAPLHDARARLAELAASWASERLLQEGARVVLAGLTNAGKSSLFNALLKQDRAIVSPTPGTTRDYLESLVTFDGIPLRLYDTAGLRDAHDPIERSGVERTQDLIRAADCIIYVIDATLGETDADRAFLAKADAGQRMVIAWNKVDIGGDLHPAPCSLPPASCTLHLAPCLLHPVIPVSAATGAGIAALVQAVKPALRDTGGPALGSERQKRLVDAALAGVQSALAANAEGFALDAVVQDLEDALAALGEITGEVTTAAVLDEVFSRFCLGK